LISNRLDTVKEKNSLLSFEKTGQDPA
jgi:hypothetical protein